VFATHPDRALFASLPRSGTVRAGNLLAEIGDWTEVPTDAALAATASSRAPLTCRHAVSSHRPPADTMGTWTRWAARSSRHRFGRVLRCSSVTTTSVRSCLPRPRPHRPTVLNRPRREDRRPVGCAPPPVGDTDVADEGEKRCRRAAGPAERRQRVAPRTATSAGGEVRCPGGVLPTWVNG
jgi:hypothetical protein